MGRKLGATLHCATSKAQCSRPGTENTAFIQYGYWDHSRQGLAAADKLQLGLRQLERAYLDDNRRELELTKNISLARLDPLALLSLRETGGCRVSLPEDLFDMDFRGHYFRRIKGLRVSIPCVAGPHTSIGCALPAAAEQRGPREHRDEQQQ